MPAWKLPRGRAVPVPWEEHCDSSGAALNMNRKVNMNVPQRPDSSGYAVQRTKQPRPKNTANVARDDEQRWEQWYAQCEQKVDQWLTEAALARRAGDGKREQLCMENAERNAKCTFHTLHS